MHMTKSLKLSSHKKVAAILGLLFTERDPGLHLVPRVRYILIAINVEERPLLTFYLENGEGLNQGCAVGVIQLPLDFAK